MKLFGGGKESALELGSLLIPFLFFITLFPQVASTNNDHLLLLLFSLIVRFRLQFLDFESVEHALKRLWKLLYFALPSLFFFTRSPFLSLRSR